MQVTASQRRVRDEHRKQRFELTDKLSTATDEFVKAFNKEENSYLPKRREPVGWRVRRALRWNRFK